MTLLKIIFSIITIMLISACSKPVPEDKQSYVGEWQSENMYLYISTDGSVAYERVEGNSTTSINAPIKEFIGDDFIVGFLFFDTTFDVSKPPQEVNGEWQMVVDGIKLTKVTK
ncbi:hypothetical protein [Spartinivicinus ruber]|uniref:hypothetical protein n=1 Tax=Spartinivicinus ruber TaxID=2683272 RepID=UPI0013D670FA|nr:hypothetical protein [Spartinivicinus ruber]